MPSIKSIKQRIRSVKNTAQITKAMEMVSATKMRRSQEFALRARPYALASLELLHNIIRRTKVLPPLLSARKIRRRALLVVTADKGLAGAINTNVLKKADAWIAAQSNFSSDGLAHLDAIQGAKEREREAYSVYGERLSDDGNKEVRQMRKPSFELIIVGKKAKDYYERRNMPIAHSFFGFGDYSAREQTLPVADFIIERFLAGSYDEVTAVYTNFRTSLLQEAVIKSLLPATEAGLTEAVRGILPEAGRFAASSIPAVSPSPYQYEYVIEPSPEKVLSVLVPQIIRMHLHHLILEANASEHSARMVAMKHASDNARELITDFTRLYNQVRQAGITRELAEISAGAEALQEI